MRILLLGLLLCLWPVSAEAAWKRADTPHFRIWSEGSEAQLREKAALLEDYRALLELTTGRAARRTAPPLDVFLVNDLDDASPWRRLGPDVAGYYRADSGRISVAVTDRPGDARRDITGQQILLHEYAHHFMLQQSGSVHPAWYVEGFAEYFATAVFRPDRIEVGRASGARAAWLKTAAWMPLDRLLAQDPLRLAARDSAMFYAQSWLLTHYMFRAPGMRPKLRAYLVAFARGEDPVQAFRRHVDADFAGFEARLRHYLATDASYSRVARARKAAPAIRIAALPPSADIFLLRQVALEHGVPAARAPEALAEIRRLAAAAPSDALARRTLALAELELGDADTARTVIDRLLAESPGDPDLLRWRAASLKPLAPGAPPEAMGEAKRNLADALSADPDDWRALHAYARLHRPVAGPLPASVLDMLMKAWSLAPQVTEVVLDTAVALSHANRLREAARVLEPLALSPHAGPASELAGRMLARAREGDRAGVLAEVTALRLRQQQVMAALGARPMAGQR